MSTPHPIALIGFSELEHSTFESLFRLAARRPPGYQIVAEASAATLILANADDGAVMAALRDRPPRAKVLLIGRSDGGTGWPRQSRPIKLMSVLTAMDQLLPSRAQAVTPQQPGLDPLAQWAPDATLPAPVHTRRLTQAVAPARAAPADESVLVVDDSDTALKFMERLLRRVGYQADLVRSGEEALQKLLRQSYRIVFVDVALRGGEVGAVHPIRFLLEMPFGVIGKYIQCFDQVFVRRYQHGIDGLDEFVVGIVHLRVAERIGIGPDEFCCCSGGCGHDGFLQQWAGGIVAAPFPRMLIWLKRYSGLGDDRCRLAATLLLDCFRRLLFLRRQYGLLFCFLGGVMGLGHDLLRYRFEGPV